MKRMWKKFFSASCAFALLLTSPGLNAYGESLTGRTENDSPTPIEAETGKGIPDYTADIYQPADSSESIIPENSSEPDDQSEEAGTFHDGMENAGLPDEDADVLIEEEAPDSGTAASTRDVPDIPAEENDPGEYDGNADTEDAAAQNAADPEKELSDSIVTENAYDAPENDETTVGTMFYALKDYSLGSNVTATAYADYSLGLLYVELVLTFKNGTLPKDWKEKLDQADWSVSGDWRDFVQTISVTIESGKGYLPADCTKLFSGITGTTTIDLTGIDTSKVTTMSSMFYNCESLGQVIFGNVNTSKVNDMKGMFSRCYSLKKVDLEHLNTSNVTDMSSMFYRCSSLEELDLSKFKTSKVTRMVSMFYECSDLKTLNVSSFDTSNVTDMTYMFARCTNLTHLYPGNFDTSKVTSMAAMFQMCESLTEVFSNNLNTQNVTDFSNMFYYCSSLEELIMRSVDTSKAKYMDGMFSNCSKLKKLDISGFDTSNVENKDMSNSDFLTGCGSLIEIRTPKVNKCTIGLPKTMYDSTGKSYTKLPKLTESILLRNKKFKDISKASVSGISLSYGYTGVFITPAFTVTLDGATLKPDVDYTYIFYNNLDPGTARLEIEGIGNYGGTRIKTFEIVDCVSSLVNGGTYQLIPKNNSKTAVCSFSGKMVNNTKVYITDRSESEAMRFIARKNTDGSWKFINAKCELALAIQQNSPEAGKGLVLYDQTTKKMQNWKLEKKSDNSFAIKSAVTGLSIAMSDITAKKGTTLSMHESANTGLQRFYFAEAAPVKNPYHATYSIRSSKDKIYAVNVSGGVLVEGANINLYKYAGRKQQMFTALYSGNGYYRFVNVNSGMVMTAKSPNAESNVVQMPWAGKNEQRWKLVKQSDGTFRLINVNGYVLHLNGNSAKDATNITARNSSTSGAQRWFLVKIS